MDFLVNKKVADGLWDLQYAIKKRWITLHDMCNDKLNESDMDSIASCLENLYWLMQPRAINESIEFIVIEEE